MIVGYLRVSTSRQNPDNQKDEIRRFAEARMLKIDSWVTDVASGRTRGCERKLGGLLKRMRKGDTLIVTEVSRLSRTLTDVMTIMGRCISKQIQLYTTKEKYCFDDSINSKVLCFAFGLVAEIERNLISMRTKEALAVRKAEGVVLGRRKGSCTKQKFLASRKTEIIAMLDEDESVAAVCRRFGVARDTFVKFSLSSPQVNRRISVRRGGRRRRPGPAFDNGIFSADKK